MKIIVIGAGIIGANVAWRLAGMGAEVTVVEAERPGGGTSGNSFAWVNSHRKPPRAYHDLNVRGMQAHRKLAAELGDQTWLAGRGCLEWSAEGESAADFEARIAQFREWDYRAEVIGREELAALVPDLDPAAYPERLVAHFPDEAWVSPVPMIHRLLAEARLRGAELRIGTGPVTVEIAGGRASGVRIGGELLGADAVINCSGWKVNSVLVDPALHIPMDPTLGLLAITPPVSVQPELVMLAPGADIRADGSGRLMLHCDPIDHQLTPQTSREALQAFGDELAARAAKLMPGMGPVKAEAIRIGTRARPVDGLPAIGGLPGLEGYYTAVMHSGATLSAWIGLAVAEEVCAGIAHPELDSFRPGRFFGENRPEARAWVQD